ncbi:MAG: winged helix-turn-helix transcriptional regulator [Planctomycetes bacterium]|nr:winged helix-turn-helix transcriptional regulator [Planctomycetota bacterium]
MRPSYFTLHPSLFTLHLSISCVLFARPASVWLGYREAIRLAEIEGLSQQEVAERLGLSLSGAKSRIQRGRAMFREALERCCQFEFDRRGNLLDVNPRPDRTVCKNCDTNRSGPGC